MSAKRKDAPQAEADANEETIASIPADPELEAALREAAAAVPEEEPDAEPVDEVLLEEAVPPGAPEEEVDRLRAQVTDTSDRLLRMQADFENFRKRATKERLEAGQFGPQNLVKDLLSVVDNLERAIGHARQSEGGDLDSLLQGVELVYRELLGVLADHHVSEIEALHKSFNPALHEAMAQVPEATIEPNTVIDVMQKGYQLRNRLVRPARVVVARAPEAPVEGGEGEATD